MGQIDARNWVFEVSDGAATPTWHTLSELTEWTLNPGENEESADTTTFDSNGMHSSQAMQRGATLELTGRYLLNSDGTRDAAQQLIEDYANLVGEASLFEFRFKHKDHTAGKKWAAWVTLGEQGGETNAKTSWACTLHRSGPSTEVAF